MEFNENQEVKILLKEGMTSPVSFREDVGQGCLLLLNMFNTYSEKMMDLLTMKHFIEIKVNDERRCFIKFPD